MSSHCLQTLNMSQLCILQQQIMLVMSAVSLVRNRQVRTPQTFQKSYFSAYTQHRPLPFGSPPPSGTVAGSLEPVIAGATSEIGMLCVQQTEKKQSKQANSNKYTSNPRKPSGKNLVAEKQ